MRQEMAREINYDQERFFSFHFPHTENHNGLVQVFLSTTRYCKVDSEENGNVENETEIGAVAGETAEEAPEKTGKRRASVKRKKRKVVNLVRFALDSEIEKLNDLILKPQDYYITANTMKTCGHARSNVFSLNNVVLDIDAHFVRNREENDQLAEKFVSYLSWAIEADECRIPMPNTVVYTGRGVQLWFALEQDSFKVANMYHAFALYLKNEVQKVLEKEVFLQLKLDLSASGSICGLYRLPGSYNTKGKSWGKISFEHEKRIKLFEAIADYGLEQDASRKKTKKHFIPKGEEDGFAVVAVRRLEVLESFIQYRAQCGDNLEGSRDNILLCYISAALAAGMDKTDAVNRTLSVNRMFPKPLSEREVASYMSTAIRKGGYSMKNEKIIDLTGMTEEEQTMLGFHAVAAGKKRKWNEEPSYKRLSQAVIAKIKELAETLSVTEISRTLGIAVNVVRYHLKKLKTKTVKEVRKAMGMKALAKNKALSVVAEMCNVSVSTVRRWKTELQARIVEREKQLRSVKAQKEETVSFIKAVLSKLRASAAAVSSVFHVKNKDLQVNVKPAESMVRVWRVRSSGRFRSVSNKMIRAVSAVIQSLFPLRDNPAPVPC